MSDWVCAGGGGYDTITYKNIKTGEFITCPGIKQIWHYGKFNIKWWIRYLFKIFIIEKESKS